MILNPQSKELLWEILCENQTFQLKIKVDINKLTQEFENNIMIITRQNNNNLNLVDLNKQFIHIMNSSCSNGTIFSSYQRTHHFSRYSK